MHTPVRTGFLAFGLLAMLALALGPSALAGAARPFQASGCSAAAADGQVAQDVPAVGGGGVELCLIAYSADGVYNARLLNVANAQQFADAKNAAIALLQAQSFDLCQLVWWQAPGSSVRLTFDDQTQLPLACSPVVLAADAAAQPFLATVAADFMRVATATVGQLGWQQDRPLRLQVYTDVNTAVADYPRYLATTLPNDSPQALAQLARNGESFFLGNGLNHLGPTILFNQTGPRARTAASFNFLAAFTFNAFASTSVGAPSNNYEYWFRAGFNAFVGERNGGTAIGYFAQAMQDQATGSFTPLNQLTTLELFQAEQDRRGGFQHPGGRAYAAIVFLAEQYGFEQVANLIKSNHNGTLAQFQAYFRLVTGMTSAEFDAALGAWLQGAPQPAQSGGANGVVVKLSVTSGGTFGEAQVTFNRPVACGTGATVPAGTSVAMTLSADGGVLSGTGYTVNAAVTLTATFDGTALSGTVQYVDASSGCDTGPVAI